MMTASLPVIIERSLDGLSMRYTAIAQNIANAGSREYRPVEVAFEEALRTASRQGDEAVRAMPITMAPAIDQSTRIDREIAEAAQTSMRYATLIDLLGRRMALHRLAAGASL